MGVRDQRSGSSMWTWLCSWLLALSLVTGSRPRMESTCDTLANKIHLTKEEFNKAKELMRTCEEDVELMKLRAPVCPPPCPPPWRGRGSPRTASAAGRLDTMRGW